MPPIAHLSCHIWGLCRQTGWWASSLSGSERRDHVRLHSARRRRRTCGILTLAKTRGQGCASTCGAPSWSSSHGSCKVESSGLTDLHMGVKGVVLLWASSHELAPACRSSDQAWTLEFAL